MSDNPIERLEATIKAEVERLATLRRQREELGHKIGDTEAVIHNMRQRLGRLKHEESRDTLHTLLKGAT